MTRVSGGPRCVRGDTFRSRQYFAKLFVFNRGFLAIRMHWLGRRQLRTGLEDAMKSLKLSGLAVAVMVLAVSAGAQEMTKQEQPAAPKRVIVVSLEDRKLALVEDGEVKKVYTVAVGKPSTPSPVGTFTIEHRVVDPTYSHGGKTVPPGPGNPVGDRWMGLSIAGYGIHGTNAPGSIGKAASHGCIRMGKADIEELFQLVAVGDEVELVGERNEETARLFGTGDGSLSPTVLAALTLPRTPVVLAQPTAGTEVAAAGVAIVTPAASR